MLELPPNLCVQVIATGFLVLAFGLLRTAEKCQGLFSLLASLRLMLSALNRVSKTSIPNLSPQDPNYSSHPNPPQKVTSPLTLERWQRAFSISPTVFLPLNRKIILFLHLYFRFHISDVPLGFHGNSLSGPVIHLSSSPSKPSFLIFLLSSPLQCIPMLNLQFTNIQFYTKKTVFHLVLTTPLNPASTWMSQNMSHIAKRNP